MGDHLALSLILHVSVRVFFFFFFALKLWDDYAKVAVLHSEPASPLVIVRQEAVLLGWESHWPQDG